MSALSLGNEQILRDPTWLAHRYDDTHDTVHFVKADRSLRRSIPFLTDENLLLTDAPLIRPHQALRALSGNGARVHFIFHSAYCCSTLLANALDIPGVSTSFKEPQILNDMVGFRHRGGGENVGQALDTALKLLARPFDKGDVSIVKPSNVVNGLATAMMAIRPEAHAVLLYAPLRVFLASIARKGMWGRLWVRDLLTKQLTDGLIDLGFEPRDYLLHTDLQAAAVGWLAQTRLFAEMAQRWPTRVRTLDSELLVAHPDMALAAATRFYEIDVSDQQRAEIVETVFSRDAKDGSEFAPQQRETVRQSAETMHAEEIEKVSVWAEAVARTANVEFRLPSPLLAT